MNIEEIREYCLLKPGVTESFPFDETTLVFKVMGKMFCLMNLDGETGLLLKNRPERVIELQEEHTFVLSGYHMNKLHWIRAMAEYPGSGHLIMQWIDESYELVASGLPRKLKEELQNLKNYDRI